MKIGVCFFTRFIGTLILIIIALPLFVVIVVPIAGLFFAVQKVFVRTARQLKRLESISRSPIFSHFGEAVTGASVIRAFKMQEEFIVESERKVDENQECYYPNIMINR